jgi:hypothetical protein
MFRDGRYQPVGRMDVDGDGLAVPILVPLEERRVPGEATPQDRGRQGDETEIAPCVPELDSTRQLGDVVGLLDDFSKRLTAIEEMLVPGEDPDGILEGFVTPGVDLDGGLVPVLRRGRRRLLAGRCPAVFLPPVLGRWVNVLVLGSKIPRLPGDHFQYVGLSVGEAGDRGLRGSWSGRGAWSSSSAPITVGLSADCRTDRLPGGGLSVINIISCFTAAVELIEALQRATADRTPWLPDATESPPELIQG